MHIEKHAHMSLTGAMHRNVECQHLFFILHKSCHIHYIYRCLELLQQDLFY